MAKTKASCPGKQNVAAYWKHNLAEMGPFSLKSIFLRFRSRSISLPLWQFWHHKFAGAESDLNWRNAELKNQVYAHFHQAEKPLRIWQFMATYVCLRTNKHVIVRTR